MHPSNRLDRCGADNEQSNSQEVVASHGETGNERIDGTTTPGSDTEDGIDGEALLQLLDSAPGSLLAEMGHEMVSAIGTLYNIRFRSSGKVEDIEKAVKYHNWALDLTPDDHPRLPDRHTSLGVSYSDRYRRTGEVADLVKAIECKTRALDLTPDGHPDLADRHASLGVSYGHRYKRTGEVADLVKAIECKTRALDLTPDGHPDLADRHASLGVSYTDRYQRTGEVAELAKAIECHTRALDLTPDGHPDLADRHASLGVSYGDRYKRTGEVADLVKAIECDTRALDLTPDGHPDLADRHASLGVSYSDRYRRTGEMTDLAKAIECKTRALDLTPDGHPDLADRHANLGVSYGHRYKRTGKMSDLVKAIECKTRALDLTPDGHPSLADRHASLGVSYTDLYECTGEIADLAKAIECDSHALALTPGGHPDLSKRHFNWAYISHLRYKRTRHSFHLSASLHSFRKSSQLLTGPPRDVFDNAQRWAALASEHSYLCPIEAFRATIDLLPHYIWLGSTSAQRYHDLSMTKNLAIRAASAAIQSSEYRLALEWLEHARCVVWNQSLMLRTPLDDLRALHPGLASQLQQTSHELHQAASGASPSGADPSGTHTPERRHHLAEQYAKLLEQVRQHRGFEHFLLPIKSDRLLRAARYGPVVVINCHGAHCDALFILPGRDHVSHLSLPKFDQQKAQKARSEIERLLRDKGIRERTYRIKFRRLGDTEPDAGPVLASLWHDVVRPVLDHLGYMNDHSSGTLPHITWCPTGIMSFLPLHAAGDYDQPRSKVFDYAISSYTPTLTALLSSSPRSLNQATKVLAIGQTNTPGCSSLPGTARELACLESHTRGKASYSQLVEDEAMATTVLDAMEQHDWVHLACHAHQNLKDPTQSGFYLHGGTLELSAINQRTFRDKGLAFLSACQTATGDKELPDEAIHMASGMLMAGYPSVIATMWSVMDEDAPFVADKVYARLMQDGQVGNGEPGKALHDAVAGLREKVGEKEFARWVPYIHMGS
ncbi:unnamed protein product [Rhizoctonia solani]|uniref:CHAT domain-containing protein n=1 Tax=Rhizoctonia solani TaxID=456999 RepID=A0A8H3H5F7_9AGAM|nr:unnamed protein product [Rhizoctonia solani]